MGRRSAGNSLVKDCDVHPSAAIAPSKLGSGALPTGATVTNANVVAGAAIDLSKLATGALPTAITVVDANVAAGAAIALSKLATGALPSAITVADANLSGSISASHLPNLARVVSIGAVAQKSANCVAHSLAGNSASNAFTIETDPVDVPRNLEVVMAAGWDGGAVVVVGTDQFGGAQTETFPTGSDVTRVGSKIFATVESATKGAVGVNAAGAAIGTGAKVGVGVDLSDSSGVCFTATGVDLAAVFSSTYDSFTPSVEPNNDTYVVIVNV